MQMRRMFKRSVAIWLTGVCLAMPLSFFTNSAITASEVKSTNATTIEQNKPKSVVTESKTETDLPNAIFQHNQNLPTQASAPLRVYWQRRESYQPLNSFDLAGRAITKLLTRSLFVLDTTNVVHTDLVEQYQWAKDTELQLKLRADEIKRCGLQAEDVVNSILVYRQNLAQYLKNNSGKRAIVDQLKQMDNYALMDGASTTSNDKRLESAYLPVSLGFDIVGATEEKQGTSLANIKNIVATSETEITIVLGSADSNLLGALDLPIVSSEVANAGNATQLSVGGKYQLSKFQSDTTELTALDEQSRLQKIELIGYDNIDQAITAFNADQLDIVILDEDSYYQQRVANTQSVKSYPSDHFYFLRTQGQFAFNSEMFLALRDWWIQQAKRSQTIAGGNNYLNLPIQNGDGVGSSFRLNAKSTGKNFSKELKPIKFICLNAVADRSIAGAFANSLRQKKVAVELECLSADAYNSRLQSQDYDLCLDSVALAQPQDPLSALVKLGQHLGINTLDSSQFSSWQQQFYEAERGQQGVPKNLADALKATEVNLPILGLGFSEQGVLCGKRIKGQVASSWYRPLERCEELWVWQVGSHEN